jgi:very-short-patch-repair endonuclease
MGRNLKGQSLVKMPKKIHPPRLGLPSHPSRGESWNPKSLYPYWEIPKNKLLTERARDLRKVGNLAEVLFWETFKNKKKFGFDIDRQVIIGQYIVDFFIPELGLVFEIDGSSHDNKIEYDAERDVFMTDLNLQVVRISDVEVKNNMSSVYHLVLKTVEKRKQDVLELFPS